MKQKTKGIPDAFQEKYPCPYYEDGRITSIEYIFPNKDEMKKYDEFLAKGYRRIGKIFYRNVCETCSACKPIRIETEKFIQSRSHKRTLKKNEDIQVEVLGNPALTAEKVLLYEKYLDTKHDDEKDEDQSNPLNTLISVHYGYPGIIEMDYNIEHKLVGVSIVDESRDSLSSNYFYYDTDFLDRRPGIFSILKEIDLARSMNKKYYYLGFYIKENPEPLFQKVLPLPVLQDLIGTEEFFV